MAENPDPNYSQRVGREELFERDRLKEPVPGWHSCALACAEVEESAQATLDAVHGARGEKIGFLHALQGHVQRHFAHAMRLGHHPGPNPEDGTTVRRYGHNDHRENGAYTLEGVEQFRNLFLRWSDSGGHRHQCFSGATKPEAEALLPDDFDQEKGRIHIHCHMKTGNDEWLPVVAPLRKLLADGWEQINTRQDGSAIRKRIEGTNVVWRGWYAFRRGLSTNLYRLGMWPEAARLVLHNSAAVVRKHYLRLEQEGTRIDAMARWEQAFNEYATSVRQIV